jgi:prepilin-type N-terminal cleavage/methylation domain-containing protein
VQNYPPAELRKPSRAERARPGASRAFTLIEIIIAVAILTVILLMAVPSLEGVFADRKLRASLDGFNKLVREAQERSVAEHRAYLIVWGEKDVIVQPEAFAKGEEKKAVATFALERGSALTLTLPAALTAKPAGEWIFWPTGTCEPAIVQFEGRAGTWTANYSPLTGYGQLANYAAR